MCALARTSVRSLWVYSVGDRGLVRVQMMEEAAGSARRVLLSLGLETRRCARQMHWMLGYKFSKTKTAPTLGGGIYRDEGGRHGGRGEEGTVGWKPRCSSVRGGFLPGDNLLQICSFHKSTAHYPPVYFPVLSIVFPWHICGELITERQPLIRLYGL